MAQNGERTSLYLTIRTKERLEYLCERIGENRSRIIAELIDREYYSVSEKNNP